MGDTMMKRILKTVHFYDDGSLEVISFGGIEKKEKKRGKPVRRKW